MQVVGLRSWVVGGRSQVERHVRPTRYAKGRASPGALRHPLPARGARELERETLLPARGEGARRADEGRPLLETRYSVGTFWRRKSCVNMNDPFVLQPVMRAVTVMPAPTDGG